MIPRQSSQSSANTAPNLVRRPARLHERPRELAARSGRNARVLYSDREWQRERVGWWSCGQRLSAVGVDGDRHVLRQPTTVAQGDKKRFALCDIGAVQLGRELGFGRLMLEVEKDERLVTS